MPHRNLVSARQNIMRIMSEKATRKYDPKLELAKNRKRWNIVRGDKVQVIGRHPEKGKQGIVTQVLRKTEQVIVEGLNKKKRTVPGDPDRGIKGRLVEEEAPIAYHKVSLLDPKLNVPTRIVRQFLEDGTKVRVAKKSGEIIPKPAILKQRQVPRRTNVTESCTSEEDAWEVTYVQPPPLLLVKPKRDYHENNSE